MDADGGHRRRPRRRPRADSRQRGGRGRHLRDAPTRRRWRPTPRSLLPAMAGQRRRALDADSRASGFVVDAKGLIATNQRVIGTATSVEVQLTPTVKVAASVLVADPARDVAVLWIDPKRRRRRCGPCRWGARKPRSRPSWTGRRSSRIGAPLREQKGMTSGTRRAAWSRMPSCPTSGSRSASAGGPVFTAGGGVVGITSVVDDKDAEQARGLPSRPHRRCVRRRRVRGEEDEGAAPPGGTHLPVEPVRPFPVDALKDAAERRAGSLNPYQMSSSDFDIAFITPVLVYGAQDPAEQAGDAIAADGAAHAGRRAGIRAPAHGLRQLVRVRGGLSAGAAGSRDAEAGGGLLDDGRARRGADAGCRPCRRSSTSSRASRGCAPSAATPR